MLVWVLVMSLCAQGQCYEYAGHVVWEDRARCLAFARVLDTVTDKDVSFTCEERIEL